MSLVLTKELRTAHVRHIVFALAEEYFGGIGGVLLDKKGGAGCADKPHRPEATVNDFADALAGLGRVTDADGSAAIPVSEAVELPHEFLDLVGPVNVDFAHISSHWIDHNEPWAIALNFLL